MTPQCDICGRNPDEGTIHTGSCVDGDYTFHRFVCGSPNCIIAMGKMCSLSSLGTWHFPTIVWRNRTHQDGHVEAVLEEEDNS